ncbi:MAG: DUF6920 family protein [Gammaproteobacteria bacterium]
MLRALSLMRWSNPNGRGWRTLPFGARAKAEMNFNSYTIPSRFRIGWLFGAGRLDPEGEFFRATVERAEFR